MEQVGVIFDLDGTLIDTADDLAASMNFALNQMGYASAPDGAVRDMVGLGARKTIIRGFELVAGQVPGNDVIDDCLKLFLDYYARNIAVHSRPFDGVIELLNWCDETRVPYAVCTNKFEKLAVGLLGQLGIAARFTTIIGADTAAKPKPDPAPALLCIDAMKVDRAIFFGDSDTDIKTAHAIDAPCFIAEFGYGPVSETADVTMFSHYRDVLEPLKKLVAP